MSGTRAADETKIILSCEGELQVAGTTWRHLSYRTVDAAAPADVKRPPAQAIVLGDVAEISGVFCRVHSSCSSAHDLLSSDCDCLEQMALAQRAIAEEGRGVIVLLEQDGRGFGADALIQVKNLVRHGTPAPSQNEAYTRLFGQADARTYQMAATVLSDLGVTSVTLLTENPRKQELLLDAGIKVEDMLPVRSERPEMRRQATEKHRSKSEA